jgi:uncharacterized protein YpmB
MGKKARYILLFILIVVSVGVIVAYRIWDKPEEMVEDVQGVSISAPELAKSFATDEAKANQQYLNKAIQVTGVVTGTEKDQDGGLMVLLQTEDPMMSIQCAMRETGATVENGKSVTIAGFCSGSDMLGVRLTSCVIK